MNSCDIGARETMQNYFDALRSLSGETLDKSGVIKAFEKGINGCELPFRTVAENFHLIDQNTRTVYVPFSGGAALIERLKGKRASAPKSSTASWGATQSRSTNRIFKSSMPRARC